MAHSFGGPLPIYGRRDSYGGNGGCYGAAAMEGGISIPNDMVLWFDGTRGVTPDGTGMKCASWTSRVGGYVATQGSGGLQPALTTQNGLTCMQFDGADDYLQNTNFAMVQPCTWFLVAKASTLPGAGASAYMLDGKLGTPAGRQIFLLIGGPPLRYGFAASNQISGASPVPDTNAHTLAAFFNGVSSVGYVDNVQAASGDGSTGSQDGVMIGGRGATGNGLYSGAICELLAYPRQLTAAELATVQVYLKAKWATT